jgi:hypothetical protein
VNTLALLISFTWMERLLQASFSNFSREGLGAFLPIEL